MGIYISGMSFPPKGTNPITLMIFPYGSVWHYDDKTDAKASNVQPHGRLIDADEFCRQIIAIHEGEIPLAPYVTDDYARGVERTIAWLFRWMQDTNAIIPEDTP